MRSIPAAAAALLVVFAIPALACGQTSRAQIEQMQRELKARHARNMADLKRKSDSSDGHFQPHAARGDSAPAWNSPSGAGAPRPRSRSLAPAPIPFNAAAAPSPDESLRAFIAAAAEAKSMEELLVYLPAAKARSLKEYQATYDPKQAAKNRAWHRQQNPKIDEESLTFLSNPPYVNELNFHKRIAAGILDVLSTKVEGNKAKLYVSTTSGATVNGVKYPYGTADIEMVGEGSAWKLETYNDNNIAYLHPPKKKRLKAAPSDSP